MDEQLTLQILDLLHTIQAACLELHHSAEAGQTESFQRVCGDMEAGLSSILSIVKEERTEGDKKVHPACRSVLASLKRVRGYHAKNMELCLKKIEFELLPLLQEAYLNYYFFQYLAGHPEKLPEFYEREKGLLCGNPYIDDAMEAGRYKYEVSIVVMAYNKLEYTRLCVENLLKNLPAGLNYELILVNHGSNDGTKEYFESIHPHKQLDIEVNGGGMWTFSRIVEGEFTIWVSNDVVVLPHTIENLLACIRSDPQIAWAVPTTPNVSNFQTIPASYGNESEMVEFAKRNNRQDPFRWEQRVRLCNPIDIRRSSVFSSSSGLCLTGWYHTTDLTHAESFPDDRYALLLRRSGYKLMLAKDAYCHHFGSVTLKDEIRQQNEQQYYLKGRKEFYRAFGVDPWGTGCCFDPVFMNRVVGENLGHTEILGINCGLGSSPLKIKEQIKEYCHNLDVHLTNLTSDTTVLQDLRGVSDEAVEVQRPEDFEQFLEGKRYDYIVWEDPFLPNVSAQIVLRRLEQILGSGGCLFVKENGLPGTLFAGRGWTRLNQNWHSYHAEG